MELRQIQYFTAIVREGSFSRAAQKLHVGQPALSRQIQALERELGVALLMRLPDGVRPTAAGSRLEEMSLTLLDHVDDIRTAVREAAASLAGTVTLGLSPSLVPALAGHLQDRFAEDHPQTRIEIVEGLPMFLAEWVEQGRLDLGVFTFTADQATSGLSVFDVGWDELMLVSAKGAHPKIGEYATLKLLPTLQLVLTPGFRNVLRAHQEFDPLARDFDCRTDSVHMVRDLVARGKYCSVLPYTFIRGDMENGVLAATSFAPVLRRRLVAVTRAGRQPSPAVRTAVDTVRARLTEFAQLQPNSAG